MRKRRDWAQRGVALILVLWVIALLSVVVVEFDLAARTELELTSSLKEDLEGYALAHAAFNLAIAEALNNYGPAYAAESGEIIYQSSLFDAEIAGPDAPGSEAAPRDEDIINARRNIVLGNGSCSYALYDEEGKMNLNSLDEGSRAIFADLLYRAAGMQIGQTRDMVFDSILDWKDEDQLHRLNGVEDEYYMGLPRPYPCKDTLFDTLEELLLVRGVTTGIFYGMTDETGQKLPGIGKYLTVYSRRGGREFHPATAPRLLFEVLALHGYALGSRDPTGGTAAPASLVAVPALVRVIATGAPSSSRLEHTIEAVVVIQPPSPSYRVVYWNDNSLAGLEPFKEEG